MQPVAVHTMHTAGMLCMRCLPLPLSATPQLHPSGCSRTHPPTLTLNPSPPCSKKTKAQAAPVARMTRSSSTHKNKQQVERRTLRRVLPNVVGAGGTSA